MQYTSQLISQVYNDRKSELLLTSTDSTIKKHNTYLLMNYVTVLPVYQHSFGTHSD